MDLTFLFIFMKDTFITKEGKRVSIGEPFSITVTSNENGVETKFVFKSDNLTVLQAKMLVNAEVLTKEESKTEIKVPTLEEAITLVGTWILGDSLANTDFAKQTIAKLLSVMPFYAMFLTLLRALAVLIDRKYSDHINNANVDKYYTIDMTNGRVCEVPKGKIKNFRNFAAFRSVDDIKIATKILRPFIKKMWPNE